MNKYKGKICPFSKTSFLEDDEVVVCDICEMPHHKDCWFENGQCTTFGCTGKIKDLLPFDQNSASVATPTQSQAQSQPQAQATFVPPAQSQAQAAFVPPAQPQQTYSAPAAQPQQQQSFAFCIYCGNKYVVGDMFCRKCGKKIPNAAPISKEEQDKRDYEQAVKLLEAQRFDEALQIFTKLADYSDSKEKAKLCVQGKENARKERYSMNNKYIGKTCPFCKAPFTEYDDIVICSQCDMPHHKDCWVENGGCTTFGCLGTIKAVDSNGRADSVTSEQLDFEPLFEEPAPQPQTQQRQQQSIIYCTRCGNPNNAEGSFCGKCGSPLRTTTPPPNYSNQQQTYTQQTQYSQPYTQQQYSQQQYNPYGQQTQSQYHNPYGFTPRADGNDARMQFVGQNQAYYAPRFNTMTTQNKKATWNWCAFFFTPFWFIYRKMYDWGAGILVGTFILSLIPSLFVSFLLIGGYITLGIMANYIYMKKIDTLVAQSSTMPDTAKFQFLAEKGGVNKKATTWAIVGYCVLNLIINIARM